MTSQVLLLREMLILFTGNELSIGMMLALWLFWVGAGSRHSYGKSGNWGIEKLKSRLSLFLASEIFLFLITVIGTRSIKFCLGYHPGELLGPGIMFLVPLAILGPVGFIWGKVFVLESEWSARMCGLGAGLSVSTVYAFESFGSALGGVITWICFSSHASVLSIFQVYCVLSLMSLLILFFHSPSSSPQSKIILIFSALIAAFPYWQGPLSKLETWTRANFWSPYELILSRDGLYGNLAVTRQEDQVSFFENGFLTASHPFKWIVEKEVHFCMLQHPNPKRALLIGGGVSGAVREILKHPVEHLDYAEPDPQTVRTALKLIPQNFPRDRTRYRFHFDDGRGYLRKSDQRYDVILIMLPDPINAQLNRFYTVEFFDEARERLTSEGVLALNASSAENYYTEDLKSYLSSLKRSLESVFGYVVIFPGGTARFYASDSEYPTDDASELIRRFEKRNIETEYFNRYTIPFELAPDRLSELHAELESKKNVPLNKDFRPRCYYFNIILWASLLRSGLSDLFKFLAELDIAVIFIIISAGFMVIPTIVSRKSSRRKFLLLSGLTLYGFTFICLELVFILVFQIIYGNIYSLIAILFTLFMLGLGAGSITHQSKAFRRLDPLKGIKTAGILTLALISFPMIKPEIPLYFGIKWGKYLLYFFVLISGFLQGILYRFSAEAFAVQGKSASETAGGTYAADLLGAGVGTILISVFFIPLTGVRRTLMIPFILNLVLLILWHMNTKRGSD